MGMSKAEVSKDGCPRTSLHFLPCAPTWKLSKEVAEANPPANIDTVKATFASWEQEKKLVYAISLCRF